MAYLKSKLQRDIVAQTDIPVLCHLVNTRINRRNVGCSGFVENTSNDKVIYVNTEKSIHGSLSGQSLLRQAEHLADYKGYNKQYVPNADLPLKIIELLR